MIAMALSCGAFTTAALDLRHIQRHGCSGSAGLGGRPQIPVGDIALVIEVGCLAVVSQTGGRRLPLANSPYENEIARRHSRGSVR